MDPIVQNSHRLHGFETRAVIHEIGMSQDFKRTIGRALFRTCESMPPAKPLLRKFGMRTSQEWFENEVVSIQLPDGKRMRLAGIADNYLTFELFWRGLGYYEPITMLVSRELAKRKSVFLDVGANVGIYSLVLGLLAPGLRIVAFEPNPKAFQLLKTNLHLNSLDQVICEPVAVSDTEGRAVLHLCSSDMSASLEDDFEATTGRSEVTKTTLDRYWASHGSPWNLLLKVDVEGHESALFRGAVDLLEARKPDIICEITGPLGEDVTVFLRKLGYRFFAITNRGLLPRAELCLNVHDGYLFLNYLFTTATDSEIHSLYSRIEADVRKIDLSKTSKRVAPEMITRLRAREAVHPPGASKR